MSKVDDFKMRVGALEALSVPKHDVAVPVHEYARYSFGRVTYLDRVAAFEVGRRHLAALGLIVGEYDVGRRCFFVCADNKVVDRARASQLGIDLTELHPRVDVRFGADDYPASKEEIETEIAWCEFMLNAPRGTEWDRPGKRDDIGSTLAILRRDLEVLVGGGTGTREIPEQPPLRINVRQVARELSDAEDEGVAGVYMVSFSVDVEGLSSAKRASMALDIFHAHQGIGCLDDFDITVIDADGSVIDQDPGHEDYSASDDGDVEKICGAPVQDRDSPETAVTLESLLADLEHARLHLEGRLGEARSKLRARFAPGSDILNASVAEGIRLDTEVNDLNWALEMLPSLGANPVSRGQPAPTLTVESLSNDIAKARALFQERIVKVTSALAQGDLSLAQFPRVGDEALAELTASIAVLHQVLETVPRPQLAVVEMERQGQLAATHTRDEIDAERYRKLRAIMGRNQEASWKAVERLAAVACYVGCDDFDQYLDVNMGEGPEEWDQIEAERVLPRSAAPGVRM